jgi:lipid-A-disaccharide synthase
MMHGRPLTIGIIAGEASGDQLGFKLMRAISKRAGCEPHFVGIGGERMTAEGLESAFPISDIAVMGILPVIARLPTLLRRIRDATRTIIEARPDVLVVIDSPDFTHRVAKRVRKVLPNLPIIDYVSPSIWAWRPGRAGVMRSYTDHVLALLPFEPAAHLRLGGPPCTYVGHPLIERLSELRPNEEEQRRRVSEPPLLVVLPGSRRSEISRLMEPFGTAVARIAEARKGLVEIVLPAVAHLEAEIREAAALWPVAPRIVTGEPAKLAAFRTARAALAASGTVTLELALSQVPMVVGYRVSRLEEQLKHFITVSSIVLPNLILGENAVPEMLQGECSPERLAGAVLPLLEDGPERRLQLSALGRLDGLMVTGAEPSDTAAEIVLGLARA